MKVTLAYPWEDHQPDQTVDVDDETGRTLLRDGFARPADGEPPGQPWQPSTSLPTHDDATDTEVD